MTYAADTAGGGFIGNHLTVAALEALRPAAYHVGRIATVGTPGQTGTYYISQGNGWQPVAALATDSSGNATGLVGAGGNNVLGWASKNGMWANPMQNAWQTTFGGYCWRGAYEIPGHARAFRVFVPKAQQGTWTVDGLAICATDTASSPARFDPGSGAAWVAGTFDGVTSVKTIPVFAPPDQYQVNNPGDGVWSDWIYCATIPRVDTPGANPIVVISIYSASANTMAVNGGSGSEVGFGSEPMHRWSAFKAAAANATGSFSSGSSDPQCLPILAFQWAPVASSISISAFGDSIMQGGKTSPLSRGYIIKTAALLTTATGYSVSSVNGGVGGDKVINSLNRFRFYCASGGGLPNIALFCPYTRNSTAAMSVSQMVGVGEVFIKTALQYGVLPVMVAGMYESAITANNSIFPAVNVLSQAMATYYNIPYIDNASIITSSNAASYLDADGIHPNNTGDDLLAANAATTLLPWVGRVLAVSKYR
jgi:lysophospholipase L1-like esterase